MNALLDVARCEDRALRSPGALFCPRAPLPIDFGTWHGLTIVNCGRPSATEFQSAALLLAKHDLISAEQLVQRALKRMSESRLTQAGSFGNSGKCGVSTPLSITQRDDASGLSASAWMTMAVLALFKGDDASCRLWLRQVERTVLANSIGSTDDSIGNLAADVQSVEACCHFLHARIDEALQQMMAAEEAYSRASAPIDAARTLLLRARMLRIAGRFQDARPVLVQLEHRLRQLPLAAIRDDLQSVWERELRLVHAVNHAKAMARWN